MDWFSTSCISEAGRPRGMPKPPWPGTPLSVARHGVQAYHSMCMDVYGCVRARVHGCVRACVDACVHVCAHVCERNCAGPQPTPFPHGTPRGTSSVGERMMPSSGQAWCPEKVTERGGSQAGLERGPLRLSTSRVMPCSITAVQHGTARYGGGRVGGRACRGKGTVPLGCLPVGNARKALTPCTPPLPRRHPHAMQRPLAANPPNPSAAQPPCSRASALALGSDA